MAENESTTNTAAKATLKIAPDNQYKPSFPDVVNSTEYFSREKDKGLINSSTGSSVLIRENGDITLSSGLYTMNKIGSDGRIKSLSMQNDIVTNRLNILTDDIAVNRHKLNPALWEMTEMRNVLTTDGKYIAGNLTILGSILVKAWDAQLKRYVLIRRPTRTPMFFPMMDTEKIPAALHIADSTANMGAGITASSGSDASGTAGGSAVAAVAATADSSTTAKSDTATEAKNAVKNILSAATTAVKETKDVAVKAAVTAATDEAKKAVAISTEKVADSVIAAAKTAAENSPALKNIATEPMTEGEKIVNAALDKVVDNKVAEVVKQNSQRSPGEIRAITEATVRAVQTSFKEKEKEEIIQKAVVQAQKAVDDMVAKVVKEQLTVSVDKELARLGVDTGLVNPIQLKAMEKTAIAKLNAEVRERLNINLSDPNFVENYILGTTGLNKKVTDVEGSAIDKLTNSKIAKLLPDKDMEKLNSHLKIIVFGATEKVENSMVTDIKNGLPAIEKEIVASTERFTKLENEILVKAAAVQAELLKWEAEANAWIAKAEQIIKDELKKFLSIKW